MAVKRKGSIPWWEQPRLFDLDAIPEKQQQMVLDLEEWWMRTAAEEAGRTIPKAVEYGSASLVSLGEALFTIAPHLRGRVSGQELAITFYVFGKLARVVAALERGDTPGEDHWNDIGIYTKMIAYIRQNGSWV